MDHEAQKAAQNTIYEINADASCKCVLARPQEFYYMPFFRSHPIMETQCLYLVLVALFVEGYVPTVCTLHLAVITEKRTAHHILFIELSDLFRKSSLTIYSSPKDK
jgi:hypothetical protein